MATVTPAGGPQAAGANRIELALCSIQEARELIEQATQILSAVAAMDSERERLTSLSSQLTWAWMAVAATANRGRPSGTVRGFVRKQWT